MSKKGKAAPSDRGLSALDRDAFFTRHFLEDLQYWIEHDRKIALRLLDLVQEVLGDPFRGKGKPEHLSHWGPDYWSRRLTEEDRLVYRVGHERVDFLQGRYHY